MELTIILQLLVKEQLNKLNSEITKIDQEFQPLTIANIAHQAEEMMVLLILLYFNML
jgi:hypothetical protein